MPCPYIRTAPYPTNAAKLHLCENPLRASDVVAPSLAQLRSHCLTDSCYEQCPGYREARRQVSHLA